jgi:ABC-type phosphate transport system substrate-binding protein
MKLLIYTFLLSAILFACSPAQSDLPNLRIAISPSAQPVYDAVSTCARVSDEITLSMEMRSPNTIDFDEVDLLITLGEPGADVGFAAQLAWEEIVLVVNHSNNATVSPEIAASLFNGEIINWVEIGGPDASVDLWVGTDSDDARRLFEEQIIHGAVSGNAHIAATPQIALDKAAIDLAAISILPAAWADQSIRKVDLNLVVPVIAVAVEEPSGAIREILACLQSPFGQEALAEHYLPFQQ